jgi:hypothetical protein
MRNSQRWGRGGASGVVRRETQVLAHNADGRVYLSVCPYHVSAHDEAGLVWRDVPGRLPGLAWPRPLHQCMLTHAIELLGHVSTLVCRHSRGHDRQVGQSDSIVLYEAALLYRGYREVHIDGIAWAGEADSPRGSSLSRSLLDTRGAQKAMPSSRRRSRSQRLEHEKTACNSNQWTPHRG